MVRCIPEYGPTEDQNEHASITRAFTWCSNADEIANGDWNTASYDNNSTASKLVRNVDVDDEGYCAKSVDRNRHVVDL